MAKLRYEFTAVIGVDRDEVPGFGYTSKSWADMIFSSLKGSVPHYNPVIEIMGVRYIDRDGNEVITAITPEELDKLVEERAREWLAQKLKEGQANDLFRKSLSEGATLTRDESEYKEYVAPSGETIAWMTCEMSETHPYEVTNYGVIVDPDSSSRDYRWSKSFKTLAESVEEFNRWKKKMRYIICKSGRTPNNVSYTGPAWEGAGIRDRYKETYENKSEAEELAKLLGEANPVGFKVFEIE